MLMPTIADFARHSEILAACTVYPWCVTVRYAVGAEATEETRIVMSAEREAPDPHDMIPEGATLLRSEVFLSTRLDTLGTPAMRARYASAYRAFRVWRKARAHCMTSAQLLESGLVDAGYFDAVVDRWITRGE